MKRFLSGLILVCCLAFSSLAFGETVTIVAEDSFFPYSVDNGGKPEGISVDIIKAAFKAVKVDVVFKVMPYDRGMSKVKDGDETAVFDAGRDSTVENDYLWPDLPLFDAEIKIYALKDFTGSIKSVKDLEGKKVAVTEAYPYGDEFMNNEKIIKEWSKTDEISLKKFAAKRTDFIILPDRIDIYLFSKMNLEGKFKKAGVLLNAPGYLAFTKAGTEGKKFLALYNQGYDAIVKNGTLEKINKDWDKKLKTK